MREYYDVNIGLYTYGSCFVPGNFDRQTIVGRYCSIAGNVRVMNRNHPTDLISTHPFFFNKYFNYCQEDKAEYIPLEIGHDVWIGYGVSILPACEKIGIGAIIGAGSVVTRDIPPYAIVVGNPGKILRYRFNERQIESLLMSKWWEKDIKEISQDLEGFQRKYILLE